MGFCTFKWFSVIMLCNECASAKSSCPFVPKRLLREVLLRPEIIEGLRRTSEL